MACTPVLSKHLKVQLIAPWAAVSLAFPPLASHGLGPLRPHPLHQSPQWLQESWSPRCPCHHALDSLLPISGSMVPSELSSAHPPLLPGVTSKHYFPNSDQDGIYILVLMDFITGVVVDVLPDRKKDSLIRY